MSGNKQLPRWNETPRGGAILEAGNAVKFKTGDWRSFRPIWNSDKCVHCLRCWVYCPDVAIKVEDGKVIGIDYDYCKGCGICSSECPIKDKAITMIGEDEAQAEK